MKHLRELQRRFQDYLISGSEDIEQDIISTENALAEHRLGAYYNAYRIRLIDCLAVDYSALEKFLGREAFENMALDYLRHYPSTHPSVRWFGKDLSAYPARFLQRRQCRIRAGTGQLRMGPVHGVRRRRQQTIVSA